MRLCAEKLDHFALRECLLEEPLTAETMIDILDKYNKFIGGNKGELKQVGLIAWMDEAPSKSTLPLDYSLPGTQ
jgi:hypothetical protein